jgi:Glutaminase
MKPNAVISNVIRIEPPLEREPADLLHAGGLTVALDDGREARLDPEDPRSSAYAQALDDLRKLRHPVYLEINPATSTIEELLIPVIARVRDLRTIDEGLEVELAPSHARHTVPRSSPDLPTLETQLRGAQQTGGLILVTESDDHAIIDVRPYVPGPDGPPIPFGLRKPAPRWWYARPLSWLWRPLRPLLVSPGWPWRWTTWVSAVEAFAAMRATSCDPLTAPAPCIPFMYPDDGCWARAHEMCRLLISMGQHPAKVWIRANTHSDPPARLTPSTRNHPSCHTNWFWHCAPTLVVRSGLIWFKRFVIDPALFNEPVPVATWKAAQNDPDATLTDSDASEYVIQDIWEDVVLSRTDPNYEETNFYLALFRTRLMVRAAEGLGPPFAQCP